MLDERQFAQFQNVDKGFVNDAGDKIGEPAWNRTAPYYRWLIDFYLFIILPLWLRARFWRADSRRTANRHPRLLEHPPGQALERWSFSSTSPKSPACRWRR